MHSLLSITIMDPNTGEILALVNYPSYDPNNPNVGAETKEEIQEMWKNRAVGTFMNQVLFLRL